MAVSAWISLAARMRAVSVAMSRVRSRSVPIHRTIDTSPRARITPGMRKAGRGAVPRLSPLALEDVAPPLDRMQQPVAPLAVDLLAQPVDGHVHHVAERVEGVVPHVIRQLAAGDHLVLVGEEVLQQGELLGREV